ncbi:hypothetical protein ACFWB2_31895 [Streptomyces virginiae]|uniref:hypothetical protein n=1 Tax=Streptomyces virginiae TaxID=1961 RepID=UPI0036C79EB8
MSTATAPPQWAAAYQSMSERFSPPSYEPLRTSPGVPVYEAPPEGCYWASGICWWSIQAGPVLVRTLGMERAHNGHRWVRGAVVDLYLADGRELHDVGLPSSSLSRDVEHLAEYTPIRIIRDGLRRPWRAVAVPQGAGAAWYRKAAQLNGSAM